MTGELPARHEFSVDGGCTREREAAARAPGAGEVLVEVSGSALGAQPGAEIAGRVVAAGEAADEWLGRRVVVPRLLPCGECRFCRRGNVFACPSRAARGGVATHETVPARYLLSVEKPLDAGDSWWRWAALADAASTPYGALVRAQVAPGDLCLVVGGGVRGRFACALARALGAHAAVLDADGDRRARAIAAGARFALDGETYDADGAREALRAEARASGIESATLKVIETTGTAAGRRRALALLDAGATCALLSDGDGGDAPAPVDAIAERQATVVGAAACHPDLLPELAALVVRGEVDLARETVALPFAALADALADRRAGRLRELPILVPAR